MIDVLITNVVKKRLHNIIALICKRFLLTNILIKGSSELFRRISECFKDEVSRLLGSYSLTTLMNLWVCSDTILSSFD